MEWERKMTLMARETESNLERVRLKLETASNGSNLDGLGARGNEVAIKENTAIEPLVTSRPLVRSQNYETEYNTDLVVAGSLEDAAPTYVLLDRSASLVTLLSDKIEAQNVVIDGLNRALKQTDKERALDREQLSQLKDELTRMQRLIDGRSSTMATERAMEQWRNEVLDEMKKIQMQVKDLRRKELEARTNAIQGQDYASLQRVIQKLQTFVDTEYLALKHQLSTTNQRLVRLEAEVSSLQLHGAQRINPSPSVWHPTAATCDSDVPKPWLPSASVRPTKNVSFEPRVSLEPPQPLSGSWLAPCGTGGHVGGPEGTGGIPTRSWLTPMGQSGLPVKSGDVPPHEGSRVALSPEDFEKIRGDYQALKDQLLDMDRNFLRDFDTATESKRPAAMQFRPGSPVGGTRSPVGGARLGGGGARPVRSRRSVSLSPTTSDLDISMLTTEPASLLPTLSATPRGARDSNHLFSDDVTTDVSVTDECLSLDDL